MDKREHTERNKEKRREGKRKERKIGRERENRVDGRRRRYRGENSDARNESSAVENPDRNQSDSICIMEKARDNVCSGLSARARFLFRLSSSLSLSPFLPSSHLTISLSRSLSLFRSLSRCHSLPLASTLAYPPFLPKPDANPLRIGSRIEWNQRAC